MRSTEVIFPYNESVETRFKQAKHLFHASMNGIVAEKLSNLGYKLNFGVSLNRIYEIASQFDADNLLAKRCWWFPCRETMILATLLLEKDLSKCPLTEEDLQLWTSRLFNLELCEQFSKNFLSKVVPAETANGRIDGEFFSVFLLKNRNSEYEIALGYITIANLLLRGVSLNEIDFILSQIKNDATSANYNVYSTVARCLRAFARRMPDVAKNVIEELKDKDGRGLPFIMEEVKTELEYC